MAYLATNYAQPAAALRDMSRLFTGRTFDNAPSGEMMRPLFSFLALMYTQI